MNLKKAVAIVLSAFMLLCCGLPVMASSLSDTRQALANKQSELAEVEGQIAEKQAKIEENKALIAVLGPEAKAQTEILPGLSDKIWNRLEEEGYNPGTGTIFNPLKLGITTMDIVETEFEDINEMMIEFRDRQHLWYTNGQKIIAAKNENKELATEIETLNERKTALEAEIAVLEDKLELPLTDISEDAWYYEGVWDVYQKGLMTGMDATSFAPELTLNRAFMAAVLYRRADSPAVEYSAIFPDVKDGEWYTKCALWAKSAGVILGYDDGRFGPTDNLTREQLCTILWRYAAENDGVDNSARASIDGYPDAAKVSDFAAEAVQWCEAMGMLNYHNGRIDAWEDATRAECAYMISKYLEVTGQEK